MKITKQKENETLTVFLEGRLDTNTGPELNKSLESDLDEVEELIIDLESLSYLSSVGLRILIGLQQKMNSQGKMVIRNVNETVMEIFNVTGLSKVFTIE